MKHAYVVILNMAQIIYEYDERESDDDDHKNETYDDDDDGDNGYLRPSLLIIVDNKSLEHS